jgi:hypothetical protein
MSTVPTLLTVKQFAQKHAAWTEGSLRNAIFLSKPRKVGGEDRRANGLDVALLRIGRKILIDEAKFFDWVNKQNS